jgi:hypothetical protein
VNKVAQSMKTELKCSVSAAMYQKVNDILDDVSQFVKSNIDESK